MSPALPEGDWLAFGLVLARLLPVALASASFTRGFVPPAVALSLSLSLASALFPLAGRVEISHAGALGLALLRELSIGGVFALSLALALYASRWALALSRAADAPQAVRGALELAYPLCAIWLVVALGGPRAIVLGLAESLQHAPPAAREIDARAFALGVAALLGDGLSLAFALALPLIVSAWLIELTVGVAARLLAPGSLASPSIARSVLFVVAAALLLVPIASRAPEAVRAALASARELVRAFAN